MEWTPEDIRELRTTLGMTQSEFAKRLGYSRQATVSDLENGRQKPSGSAEQIMELLQNSLGDQAANEAKGDSREVPTEDDNSQSTWMK